MSQRYKGAVISATPPTTTGGNSGTAPGIWTMQQQLQAQGGGVWPNQPINYIEDVFSAWLYAGSNSGQTLTDGINRTLGALDWFKVRNLAGENHILWDTARSGGLETNTTANEATVGRDKATYITQNNGNVVLNFGGNGVFNSSGYNYVKWTFRKQPKFFDIVTWTGNGANPRQIAHNLGSVPGCIIIKSTTRAENWTVYHTSLGNTGRIALNTSDPAVTGTSIWANTTPTSTYFTVTGDNLVNFSGDGYVAYLFAHNAGGFGTAGTDNVISCGSFTVSSGTGSTDVNLGYEPQWLLAKPSTDPGFATNWNIYDTMRGWVNTTDAGNVNRRLNPNTTNGETSDKQFQPTATGFTMLNSNVYPGVSITYIYIAIRRGPMQTPTTGTSVYGAVSRTGTGANATVASSFPVDLYVVQPRSNLASTPATWINRLAGGDLYLRSNATFGEATLGTSAFGTVMNGVSLGGDTETNYSSSTFINWFMRRAPGFMDVVCYTGTGSATTFSHNLGVVPELMIVKRRNSAGSEWKVYSSSLGNNKQLYLDYDYAVDTPTSTWNNTTPTASVFSVGGSGNDVNESGGTYVSYLFASCAGVSKVGSYTGTGATQTISCGFAARFVMIKRTDSTGSWWVWDTTRGMVAGTDPRLAWQTTSNETNANWVYTDASGFQIVTTDATVNASGGSYIYLAIA